MSSPAPPDDPSTAAPDRGGPPPPRDPASRRFTRDAARAVDREAIDDWGMPGLLLMENAARAVTEVIRGELAAGGREPGGPVVIVCGPGNNGGDGWAIARQLANLLADGDGDGDGIPDAAVRVVSTGEPRAGTDAAVNAAITRRMGIPVDRLPDLPPGALVPAGHRPPRLVVDAVLGTGLDRPAEGPPAAAIAAIARAAAGGARVIAVDVPSGLDADTGEPAGDGPAVRADVTVSFLGPKAGFAAAGADAWTGRVVVGDIGVPREVLDRHASA
jgi:NAD(P)H-hydrate epimerase